MGGCVENAAASSRSEAEHRYRYVIVSETAPCNGEGVGVKPLPVHLVDYEGQSAASVLQDSWRSRTHMQIAESYCMQRNLLLQRVAADLECQALLV